MFAHANLAYSVLTQVRITSRCRNGRVISFLAGLASNRCLDLQLQAGASSGALSCHLKHTVFYDATTLGYRPKLPS